MTKLLFHTWRISASIVFLLSIFITYSSIFNEYILGEKQKNPAIPLAGLAMGYISFKSVEISSSILIAMDDVENQ